MTDQAGGKAPTQGRYRQLNLWQRFVAGGCGLAGLALGSVATFTTSNSVAAGVMFTVGGLFSLIAITGNPISKVSIAGNTLEIPPVEEQFAAEIVQGEIIDVRAAVAEQIVEGRIPAVGPVRELARGLVYRRDVLTAITALGGFVRADYAINASVLDALVVYNGKRIGVEAMFPIGSVGLQQAVERVDRIFHDAPADLELVGMLIVISSAIPRDFRNELEHTYPEVRIVIWVGDNTSLKSALQDLAGVP